MGAAELVQQPDCVGVESPWLTQIVPNSSSDYTLFYSVISNSVVTVQLLPNFGEDNWGGR